MPWLQISVTAFDRDTEQVESVLLQHGASSITYRDAEDRPILEPMPGETPIWEHSIVTGLFDLSADTESLLNEIHIALENCEHNIEVETLEDQDWERAWMEHYQPMQFGEHFWVIPTHVEPVDAKAVNLRLDPGLAFGTGTHPTTSLCLKWLCNNTGSDVSVLDYGCGSGILAIAALLLGARQADGVDIDPQAIEASRSNAEINRVKQLQLYLVKDFQPRQYDVVLANILSGPLGELAPVLSNCTRPGGDIVLSGILQEQAETISAIYAETFDMDAPVIEGDWVMLHGCRKL